MEMRRALSQTPVTWTPPAPPARRRTYWGHERTNEHRPSHVRVDSCPNASLTPTFAIGQVPDAASSTRRRHRRIGATIREFPRALHRRHLRVPLHPRSRTHPSLLRGDAPAQALAGSPLLEDRRFPARRAARLHVRHLRGGWKRPVECALDRPPSEST